MFRRFWWWLLDRLGLLQPPSPLVRMELDMANARLSWTLPTPNPKQLPLDHVRVESRVSDTLPYSEIANVPVPEDELLVQDIAPGDWQFRGIVVDQEGNESLPLEATLAVPFEGPSPLQEFVAELA